jgi:RNA polymerase sigma factor (sigma-70 family)
MNEQPARSPSPLSGLSDEQLVARVKQTNDQPALAVLVERYTDWIWDRLRPRAQRDEFQEMDVEDGVQDGLLVRVIPRFPLTPPDRKPRSTFRTYFEKCLSNRFGDICRARRRAHRHLSLFADLGWVAGDDPPPGTLPCVSVAADPAASIEAQEQGERLQTALERLSPDEYLMVAWVGYGFPRPRIARSFGISLATFNRALRKIRAQLRRDVNEPLRSDSNHRLQESNRQGFHCLASSA